jgi:tRNA pseudouridine55 synthase
MEKNCDYDFQKGEILLINKPYDWSSFDLVRKLKNVVKAKIGHGGTLDPLATGLMLLATGSYTKKLNELQNLSKEYTGVFCIGATTPSYDRESAVENEADISHITKEAIEAAASSFKGAQEQIPPVFSAIKVDGKRSYELARKGEAKELKARNIEITAFAIEAIDLPYVHFRVACTKGTYIRSLAHDFGQRLGVGAYLYELCRTRIGEYRLEDAWELADFIACVNSRRATLNPNEDIPVAGKPSSI